MMSMKQISNGSKISYWFSKFENDVQKVFDEIGKLKNIKPIIINLKRRSFYRKADYFIPMKSTEILQFDCKELLERLGAIPGVRIAELDANCNLIISMKRSAVYEENLLKVQKLSNRYGMFESGKSVLVFTSTFKAKNLDNYRTFLSAEHLITLLASNNVKVSYNSPLFDEINLKSDFDSELQSNSFSWDFDIHCENTTELNCPANCSFTPDVHKLKEEITANVCLRDHDIHNAFCSCFKKYIESELMPNYGNVNLVPPEDKFDDYLSTVNYIKHLIDDHMQNVPDFIIHVAPHSQMVNVYRTAMLLDMIRKGASSQVYVFNQAVKPKTNICEPEQFFHAHKLEIQKALQHKYEVSTDATWTNRIQSLAKTAMRFDFLKTNTSHILNLKLPSHSSGEKNNGVFAQYNYARLSNLFRNFEEKVKEGYYEPLPPVEKVDFNLLRFEEEWDLFHYVLTFPKMVQGIVESVLTDQTLKSHCRLNKICGMLQELCQALSVYYSKIRILSGPQPQLQRIMFARLWLLKGIHQTIENSFSLLNVNGLDLM